jgi:hypothetical protein
MLITSSPIQCTAAWKLGPSFGTVTNLRGLRNRRRSAVAVPGSVRKTLRGLTPEELELLLSYLAPIGTRIR